MKPVGYEGLKTVGADQDERLAYVYKKKFEAEQRLVTCLRDVITEMAEDMFWLERACTNQKRNIRELQEKLKKTEG
jgi:hypothetical protein